MFIEVKNVSKDHKQADGTIHALKPISFSAQQNETLAIIGPSGSGKTTLLSLLAGLDTPSAGTITLAGETITSLNERELARFRAQKLGIVFQQFHLMPHLTAYENVSLPLEILGQSKNAEKIKDVLNLVGLSHRLHHLPSQLSGGEQQRVAIARAIVHNPTVLLADEPSGNLDSATGHKVMDLIFSLVDTQKLTLLLVTHDPALAERCQRQIRLQGDA